MAELFEPQQTALAAPQTVEITPLTLLQLAIEKSGSIDVIERLAKLQREQQEYSAKVQFEDAMARAQRRMKRISADATNPQTHSRYATYAKLDRELRPIYSDEGFALSFGTAESPNPDMMRLTCHVSHAAGYGRDYQIDMPADGKGAKGGDVMTKTHATGAAATYGMRYLLKMIFNVAIGEDDNDGNQGATMDPDERDSWLDKISICDTEDELKRTYLGAQKAAQGTGDAKAAMLFAEEKNKRLKELRVK